MASVRAYLVLPRVWWATRSARDRDAVLARQTRRLRALLRHAAAHVPYYQQLFSELGLDPKDIGEAADLDALPLLEREDLQALHPLFLSAKASVRGCQIWSTSGTTGRPLSIPKPLRLTDAEYVRQQRRLAQLGLHERDFRPFGSNYVFVSDTEYRPWLRRISVRTPIWRMSRMEKFDIRAEFCDPLEVIAQISRMRPAILTGKPSSLLRFAEQIDALDTTRQYRVRPRVILGGGEQLLPATRRHLQAFFDCPVYDVYGLTETGSVACECHLQRGLHFEDDEVLVEVVRDGRRVDPGELGELVVTDLRNTAFPIIRYRTGDLGRVSYEQCPCGTPYPRITALEGRDVDAFVSPSGERFNPFVLLGDLPGLGLTQYQLVQRSPERILVRYVGAQPVEAVIDAVRPAVDAKLGSATRVDAERLDALAEPGTKVRLYVNEIPGVGSIGAPAGEV